MSNLFDRGVVSPFKGEMSALADRGVDQDKGVDDVDPSVSLREPPPLSEGRLGHQKSNLP